MVQRVSRIVLLFVAMMSLFNESCPGVDPAAENRDAVLRFLKNMAARAQEHYQLDVSQGGGHGAFDGSTGGVAIGDVGTLTARPSLSWGSFYIATVSAAEVVIFGTGIVTGYDGTNPIEIVARVSSDSLSFTFNN